MSVCICVCVCVYSRKRRQSGTTVGQVAPGIPFKRAYSLRTNGHNARLFRVVQQGKMRPLSCL